MMERYPVVKGGRVRGSVRTLLDFIEVGEPFKYYLWLGERGVEVEGDNALLRALYEPGMSLTGYAMGDYEDYVDTLAEALGEKLRGKTVMVNFSGGKDSVATLYLLSELREKVDFRLYAVYIYMPHLEPPGSMSFAEEAAAKLGVDFLCVETDRKRVEFYLSREGLPRRGRRWCTYLKIMALRKARKELKADFEAKGDRVIEAGKRLRRLIHFLRRRAFLDGAKVNVVYPLTILDVAHIVRKLNLVHPHYLAGIPRVSCKYCPYKSLYELYASEEFEVEDEGFVEYIARREHYRIYSPKMSWEEYWGQHAWRFDPTVAELLTKLRRELGGNTELMGEDVREMFRSIWVEELPRLEVLGINGIEAKVKDVPWIRRDYPLHRGATV